MVIHCLSRHGGTVGMENELGNCLATQAVAKLDLSQQALCHLRDTHQACVLLAGIHAKQVCTAGIYAPVTRAGLKAPSAGTSLRYFQC